MSLVPKYYLLAGDTSQVSIFSSHKIKMSKQRGLFILEAISISYILAKCKMFTFLCCLLCLYENRKYPGSFQNKLVSSSFK